MTAQYTTVINCGRDKGDGDYFAEIVLCLKPDDNGLVPEALRSPRAVMGEALTAEWGELEARFTPGRLIRWKSIVVTCPVRNVIDEVIVTTMADIRSQMG